MVSAGSRLSSRRSEGTARAITSMCSMPSRYCVTVKPDSSVCRVWATSWGVRPSARARSWSTSSRIDLTCSLQSRCGSTNPKIVDPHLDWSEQVKSIRLEVDQDRARALGLTPQDVAQTLQTLLSGFTVTQYREGIEHIEVIARAVPSERLELGRLPALTVATRNG